MADDLKKLGGSGMQSMILGILKKSLDNKTLSKPAYDRAVRSIMGGSEDMSQAKQMKLLKGGGLSEATAKLKAQGLKKGKQVKKKKKKSFPDLNKDGKVTMKDILIGRGVIKKAKVGMQMKGTSPLIKRRK
tara:strand:- start:414 stop:806 length:393 start_codon:yes stop_codon:yes gene_type:complete